MDGAAHTQVCNLWRILVTSPRRRLQTNCFACLLPVWVSGWDVSSWTINYIDWIIIDVLSTNIRTMGRGCPQMTRHMAAAVGRACGVSSSCDSSERAAAKLCEKCVTTRKKQRKNINKFNSSCCARPFETHDEPNLFGYMRPNYYHRCTGPFC